MAWKCPFCSQIQIVGEANYSHGFIPLFVGKNKHGRIGLSYSAIACLNTDCQEISLNVGLYNYANYHGPAQDAPKTLIQNYPLRPESSARVFPEFIPAPLRQDYLEACRIKTLSPKASATLARRCLQGIIRDFCGISKGTLDAEIKALEAALSAGKAPQGVTHESIEAIDHVRKIGNIGAHMEKDINLIVDIDEGEAQALIDLIELLFEEWYIEREQRIERLARLKAIRDEKEQQKANTP